MQARLRDIVFLVVVLGGAGTLAAGLLRPLARLTARPSRPIVGAAALGPIVGQVDGAFRLRWTEQRLIPAAPAPELAVMRRLSLSLCWDDPFAGGGPPVRGPAGWTMRIDAWLDDLLQRPSLRRLPGRAIRAGVRRHGRRPVPQVPPPPLRGLAQ